MMRQRIFGMLAAAVFAAAAVPAFLVSAYDQQIKSEQTGDGYWEGWNQDYKGTYALQDHPDGSISGRWDGIMNCIFRNGVKYAEPKEVGGLLAYDVAYKAEIETADTAWYGVNGYYKPEAGQFGYGEFYVIEGWNGYRPPGSSTERKGTAEINGIQYDLYITVQNIMGIDPPPPVVKYWSVRQENAYPTGEDHVCEGTVPLLEHVRAWEAIDGTEESWPERKIWYAYFEAEAYGGTDMTASGRCEITAPEISIRYAADETLTGDANCDGIVDISDAVLVMRYAVEDREAAVTEQGLKNADADKNGRTDESDAAMILQYIAKKTTL